MAVLTIFDITFNYNSISPENKQACMIKLNRPMIVIVIVDCRYNFIL